MPGISEIPALIQWTFPESSRCELLAPPPWPSGTPERPPRLSEVMGKTDTQTVARLLREYAQRTSLRGGNPYRAKAYLTAADSLGRAFATAGWHHPGRHAHREIPGIGYAIADIITKLHQTGSHPSLEKLRKDVPEGVLELFAIPGIRPDKILKLHQELGISSLAELEEAARTRSYSKGERPRRFTAERKSCRTFR